VAVVGTAMEEEEAGVIVTVTVMTVGVIATGDVTTGIVAGVTIAVSLVFHQAPQSWHKCSVYMLGDAHEKAQGLCKTTSLVKFFCGLVHVQVGCGLDTCRSMTHAEPCAHT
jgi:hypothetical protein